MFVEDCDLIESNPRPPEHEDSDDGITGTAHGRLSPLVPATYARSQHDGSHQSPGPAHQVDPAAAGNVYNAQGLEEPLRGPEPARGETEDEGVEEGEDHVEVEVGPLSQRSRYDCGA